MTRGAATTGDRLAGIGLALASTTFAAHLGAAAYLAVVCGTVWAGVFFAPVFWLAVGYGPYGPLLLAAIFAVVLAGFALGGIAPVRSAAGAAGAVLVTVALSIACVGVGWLVGLADGRDLCGWGT